MFFYVKVFKTKKGTLCACLRCNLGYADKLITFDTQLIAEILGISVRELLSECREIKI